MPIEGNVSGLGAVRHREFAMASGEMSQAEFTGFLVRAPSRCSPATSAEGSMHYICMDWRHMGELLSAGRRPIGTQESLRVGERQRRHGLASIAASTNWCSCSSTAASRTATT